MTEIVPAPVFLPEDPVESIVPVNTVERRADSLIDEIIDELVSLIEANPADLEGQARAHLLVDKWRRKLAYVTELLRPLMVANMGSDKLRDLDGVGRIQRRTGVSYRNWQHDDLRGDVRKAAIARCALDIETGEIDAERQGAVDDTLALIWQVFGRVTPNAGGVRTVLGHQPDEYAEVTYGDQQITITGGKK